MLFATTGLSYKKIRAMKYFILFILSLMLSLPVFATSGDNLQTQKEQIETELKIYPNPVKNNQLTISMETKTFVELRLLNIAGKEVVKEMYDFPLHKTVLRLSDTPNGIYILQLKTEDQQLIAKKVLVSKE